jgi:hypothetical protein
MIGSMIELILIFVLFIVNIIFVVIFTVLFSVVKSIEDGAGDLKGVIRDPIGSISKIPKSIADDVNTVTTSVKKISKQLARTRKLSR